MTKKGSNIIGLLVIILAVFILIAVFIVGSKNDAKSSAKYFKETDKVVASNMYDALMELTEDNYPQDAKGVLKLYLDGYRLLYGDKIKDLSIVPSILEKQRLLFSESILQKNTLEEQKQDVLKNIDNLKKSNMKVTQVFIEEGESNEKNNKEARLVAKIQDNMLQQYEYIYILNKDENGRWRISSFKNTAVSKVE